MAGADPGPAVVRLAGLAGLIAGAISMAAGEYNSMRVQSELLERELRIEARELRRRPEHETGELAEIYEQRGPRPRPGPRAWPRRMMSDPEMALEAHAREELGIDPQRLGSPRAAAASSFVAFSVGALVPLVPWFVTSGRAAKVASLVLGVLAAVVVGMAHRLAPPTGRSVGRSPARCCSRWCRRLITFAIGNALGVGAG